jgi:hypothetical protein
LIALARRDVKKLAEIFAQATPEKVKMWGGTIIFYGEIINYRANGDQALMRATGFSIGKSGLKLYIMTDNPKLSC